MDVVWSRTALNDLEAIREFIARDNPAAAARTRGAILRATGRLADHPSLGRAGRVAGTRELIVAGAPYIVAYRVADNQVRIIAVIHTSRRWPQRF